VINQETRVGLFVIGAAILIGVGSFYLGDVHLTKEYDLNVLFDNAGGLPIKGAVKSAGVTVGHIEKIDLQDGRARVTAHIDRKYQVHSDARARVASTGFIGSKFLELNLGSPSAPLLQDGDTIEGKPSVSFDDWMERLSGLFRKDDKYGDPVENIKATLANLRDATGVMRDELKQNRKGFDSILKNTRKLVADLREITDSSKENIKAAVLNFKNMTARAEALLKQVQEGKGAVGALVSDEETSKNVKQTVASLKQTAKDAESLLGRIRRVSVYWDYRQRYDFADSRFRPDFGIKIVPRPGKYYSLMVNNIGDPQDRNAPGNDFQYRNTVTIVMGKDLGPFTLYAGVIRAQGGVGGAFRPFWKNPAWARRFEFQAEAFNLNRNETVQGVRLDKPVYNAGARVGLLRWLYAGVQMEDMAVRNHVVGNINVQLKDEDIAYLFGLASFAGPVK
jgi:phospholipid/cholesterol/gamma-HCH transport system substrate-binding protein